MPDDLAKAFEAEIRDSLNREVPSSKMVMLAAEAIRAQIKSACAVVLNNKDEGDTAYGIAITCFAIIQKIMAEVEKTSNRPLLAGLYDVMGRFLEEQGIA